MILLASVPCSAEEQARPITFTSSAGVLATGGIMDLPGGTYALFGARLDAHPHRTFGFFLDYAFLLPRQTRFEDRIPRFFTAGMILSRPAGPFDLAYRLGYGVIFAEQQVSTLFVHGLSAGYRMGERWRLLLSARQLVPNDWFQDRRFSESWDSVAVSLGWGAVF